MKLRESLSERFLRKFVLFAASHRCVRATERHDGKCCADLGPKAHGLCVPCAGRLIKRGRRW